jgi:hypothetical protein
MLAFFSLLDFFIAIFIALIDVKFYVNISKFLQSSFYFIVHILSVSYYEHPIH